MLLCEHPGCGYRSISLENAVEMGCGQAGIAVVSAVFGKEDVRTAAAELKALMES